MFTYDTHNVLHVCAARMPMLQYHTCQYIGPRQSSTNRASHEVSCTRRFDTTPTWLHYNIYTKQQIFRFNSNLGNHHCAMFRNPPQHASIATVPSSHYEYLVGHSQLPNRIQNLFLELFCGEVEARKLAAKPRQ
jgi:hypothetical protein